MLGLRKMHNLLPEDIDHIEAIVQANKVHILIHPQPQTGLEGKFSLEYCLETAALEGELRLRHFIDAWVRRPQSQTFTHSPP
jgi:2-methylcitrate dehydratase PrpD